MDKMITVPNFRVDMDDNQPVFIATKTPVSRNPLRSTPLFKTDSSNHGNMNNTIKGDNSSVSQNRVRPTSSRAKFCPECGNKYPTSQVKFCPECGLRRIQVSVK